MMHVFSFLLLALLQTPAPAPAAPASNAKVIVGLADGQQLVVEDPEFSGFIKGRNGEAVLLYRRDKFHGEMPASAISRIDFGKYRRGRPFALTVMLKNGQKLDVETEHGDYVTVSGKTDAGMVLIKHPDPISAPLKLSTSRPNRKNDLTIQYLEFPAS